MIAYQLIRARYELAVQAALDPEGVVLHYDNVEEEPIPQTGATAEYAVISISFPSSTEPDICGGVVYIRGNVQVNIAGPRGAGMRRLEMLAGEVICALMAIGDYPEPEGVLTGVQGVQGPTPVLAGQDPQATVVVSAPFTARVELP